MAGAIAISLGLAANAFAEQPADLIVGVVARAKAIVSGRITYAFKSESFVGQKPVNPITLPEVTTSFSDSSWADRAKGSHVVRINHDGYFLEFVQTPQRDGSVRPGATLSPRKPLENRAELNSPPIFAGSFWHREQLRYIEKHANDFGFVETSVIQAVPVTILELPVAAEQAREAFHILPPALKQGGMIRLYIAPQLGFVLPRIEFVAPSNEIAQSYEAMDFSEVAPGIYFPRRIWNETHAAGGANRYRGEFTVRGELINEAIPEEDFVVELPIGTRVQDAHEPGDVIKFELTEPTSSAKVWADSASRPLGPSSGIFDRWGSAGIIGALIGAVASISFLLAVRNQRSHG